MSNDYLPLLTRLREPVAVYIVDNNIIGMYDTGISYHGAPPKVFELLKQLYNYPPVKKIIPEILHEYLDGKIRVIEKDPNKEYERIFGFEEMGICHCCFDFDLKIGEEIDKPIVLYNFIYEFQRKKITYEYQLNLSIKEAFIILANVCSTIIVPNLISLIKSELDEFVFDEKLLKQIIVKKVQPQFHSIYNFVNEYLGFQQKQLEKRTITPYELLLLNGTDVLAVLIKNEQLLRFFDSVLNELCNQHRNLSKNKLILYYTLFLVSDEIYNNENSVISEKIEAFKQQYKTIIQKIEKELMIGLPILGKQW